MLQKYWQSLEGFADGLYYAFFHLEFKLAEFLFDLDRHRLDC